jgi:hypothetical protein
MSVYEVAIETIIICFLEDEAENVVEKPSFASGGSCRVYDLHEVNL